MYNVERILKNELEKLKDDINGETLRRYYWQRVAEGITPIRQYKCINTLRSISKTLGKEFRDASKEDIIELLARLEQRQVSAWTKHDYRVILKKFYQWLYGYERGEYPEHVKWIRSGNHIQNNLKKSDLLTVDEIKRLCDAAKTLRDKAFILTLAESGRRIGEILTLRICDIEFDSRGARLHVDGKMGRDHARIMGSAPILATWLDMHPRKNDPSSPVWVTEERFGAKQIQYASMRQMFKDCVKRAGLKKRVWFYLLRHTRGTQASTKLNAQQLCALMGWKQGSDMPSVYVHLSGEDIDDAQAILNGTSLQKEDEPKLQPIACNRCGFVNSSVSKFCNKCGLGLDIKAMAEMDERKEKVEQLLYDIIQNDQKLEKLREFLSESYRRKA
jgi:integrase